MQYKSIIRLFEYCGIDGDRLDAGRIRKIISAEFALAESGIISIDGFDYSKNDALAEIDSPDFVRNYSHHKAIWNNGALLDCLERNKVTSPDLGTQKSLGANLDLASFVSPYFAVSFDKIMRRYLRDFDFKSANKWMETMSLLDTPEDEARALEGIRLYFAEFISRLKNSNSVTYAEMFAELNAWGGNGKSSELVNCLMPFLPDTVNSLARALINFTVAIQFADKMLCYCISLRLTEIQNLRTELSELILENHKIYKSQIFIDRRKLRKLVFADRKKARKLAWIPFVLIYLAFRICSSQQWNVPYETPIERAKILREMSRNSSRSESQPDFSYSGDERPADIRQDSPPADSFPLPESNGKYSVDPELFKKLRQLYSRVERSTLDNIRPVFDIKKTQLFYLRFFHASRRVDSPVVLNVQNRTAESVTLYIDAGESSLLTLRVESGKKLKLQRTFNRLEILASASRTPATVLSALLVKSLLICDERNVVEHTFDSFPGTGILNVDTDKPDSDTDFELLFLPCDNGDNGDNIRMSFPAGYVGY
ncbi:MAG: hypothetical protein LBD35_02460 [Prevotellaceae bacterium]|nr:hypothetical protein [Prevotellaceae bacterium]